MKDQVRVGWFAFWLGTRIVCAFFLYSLTLDLIRAIRSQSTGSHDFFAGAVLISLGILLHPYASGYADRAGLHFRRYFVSQFVPWDQVERVEWSTQDIRVFLRAKPALYRWIDFKLQSGPMDAINEAFGESVREPEFICWLASTPLEKIASLQVRHLERPPHPFLHWISAHKDQLVAIACVWGFAIVLGVFLAAKSR